MATYTDEIENFSLRYHYDMTYQKRLLADAPEAFQVFAGAQKMSSFRKAVPLEAHFVARIAMMMGENCGDCIQINMRMALEAGLDRELIMAVVEQPDRLSSELQDVRNHALQVADGPDRDEERRARLKSYLGDEGLAEMAVCLAGCGLFTTAKRSLGMADAWVPGPEDF